jgi:hypothetical protein
VLPGGGKKAQELAGVALVGFERVVRIAALAAEIDEPASDGFSEILGNVAPLTLSLSPWERGPPNNGRDGTPSPRGRGLG